MALLQSANQIVNQTALARNGSELFERIAANKKDRLVVVKNNSPVAVMLNVHAFEDMQSELESLRNEVAANRRFNSLSLAEYHTEEQIQLAFG